VNRAERSPRIDKLGVTGSSPVPPTSRKPRYGGVFHLVSARVGGACFGAVAAKRCVRQTNSADAAKQDVRGRPGSQGEAAPHLTRRLRSWLFLGRFLRVRVGPRSEAWGA
jgi:hypothetical protein